MCPFKLDSPAKAHSKISGYLKILVNMDQTTEDFTFISSPAKWNTNTEEKKQQNLALTPTNGSFARLHYTLDGAAAT